MSDQGVLIRQLQGVLKFLTGKSIAFGSATLTWTGSAASAAITVPHGLGSTPVPFATMKNTGAPWAAAQVDPGATQLTIVAHTTDGSTPTTTGTVFWLAIG